MLRPYIDNRGRNMVCPYIGSHQGLNMLRPFYWFSMPEIGSKLIMLTDLLLIT